MKFLLFIMLSFPFFALIFRCFGSRTIIFFLFFQFRLNIVYVQIPVPCSSSHENYSCERNKRSKNITKQRRKKRWENSTGNGNAKKCCFFIRFRVYLSFHFFWSNRLQVDVVFQIKKKNITLSCNAVCFGLIPSIIQFTGGFFLCSFNFYSYINRFFFFKNSDDYYFFLFDWFFVGFIM